MVFDLQFQVPPELDLEVVLVEEEEVDGVLVVVVVVVVVGEGLMSQTHLMLLTNLLN